MKKNESKSRENNNFTTLATIILMTVIGFFIGKIDFQKPEVQVVEKAISSFDSAQDKRIPMVILQKRDGDQIFLEISGDVKITWADNYSLEDSGIIYFSQIPTENDLKLNDFKYLGNAKTHKFYPTKSYPARGTEVRYRRFFQTKDEAVKAGFVPSKLVK